MIKPLNTYLATSKRHDPELLNLCFDKAMGVGANSVTEFLFTYSKMGEESADAILGKVINERLGNVEVVRENLPYFDWYGKVLRQAFFSSRHIFSHLQKPIDRYMDFFLNLAFQITQCHEVEGTCAKDSFLPWFDFLTGYDNYTEEKANRIGSKILDLILKEGYSADYPLSFLLKFNRQNLDLILRALTKACSDTNKEEVISYLRGRSYLGNIRSFVYTNALLMTFFSQSQSADVMIEKVKNQNWSDAQIWVIAESCYHDISYTQTGVRFDEMD
ncbi:MAG: hypothetical protein IT569_09900, partial [Leptospiraceae bacterium]|nr:hypothetical protein [Leptospiraceae bacterium]